MNDKTEITMFLDIKTIIFCICIMSGVLIILQFIELLRFYNYGKVPKNQKVDCKECSWRYDINSSKSISVPHCIRPAIFLKSNICKGQCKYMKYSNIPTYPKSLRTLVLESILSVINFAIVIVTFLFNIFT